MMKLAWITAHCNYLEMKYISAVKETDIFLNNMVDSSNNKDKISL